MPLRQSQGQLADGREIIFFDWDEPGAAPREIFDARPLGEISTRSEMRWDPVLSEWVTVAAHRQSRTYLPKDDLCPLCPSVEGRLSEIPAKSFQVVVFENRFPSYSIHAGVPDDGLVLDPYLHLRKPAVGRCEVVVFSDDHNATFSTLAPERVRLVVETWAERTSALGDLEEVEQVFCFENRGRDIGVTLSHPHGQIYAYPVVTSRTRTMLDSAASYRRSRDRDLFEDLLSFERSAQVRVVDSNDHWVAFVPAAARWPFEVHLYPLRRVVDLPATTADEREALAQIYSSLLRRLDNVWGIEMSYIAAWHQAPKSVGRDLLWLHLELFSITRAPGKVKALAGSESGMGMFVNDVAPEAAAAMLRAAGA